MITRPANRQVAGGTGLGTRMVFLVLVMFYVSGCSPYQDVSISDEVVMDEVGELSVRKAKEGDQVRLTTMEGLIIAGRVVATTEEAISIVSDRDGVEETVSVPRNEIARMEIKVGDRSDVFLVIGCLAVFIGILAANVDIME